jgi:hypothetical protein
MIEKDDDLKFIFYEEERDRYRCIVKGKYVKSSTDLQEVIDARDDFLKKSGIDMTEIGVSRHPYGHFIYRRNLGGVRYEIFKSKDKEEVLKAKEIFDGRFRKGEISIPQIESYTRNGDEPDRRTVRGIAKDDERIWGDPGLFI